MDDYDYENYSEINRLKYIILPFHCVYCISFQCVYCILKQVAVWLLTEVAEPHFMRKFKRREMIGWLHETFMY